MDADNQSMLSRDEMERRRLAAAQDLLNGISQSHVARKFGVSRTTASRWHRALAAKGVESLRKRRAPGRPSRLSNEQTAQISDLFMQGAAAFGFPNDRWTTARLAAVIEDKFGVRYDPDHVGRLMHKLGLKQKRAVPAGPPVVAPAYAAARYSPNTEISPTVA
jgi:transposase